LLTPLKYKSKRLGNIVVQVRGYYQSAAVGLIDRRLHRVQELLEEGWRDCLDVFEVEDEIGRFFTKLAKVRGSLSATPAARQYGSSVSKIEVEYVGHCSFRSSLFTEPSEE
jgi:hypothetical protein